MEQLTQQENKQASMVEKSPQSGFLSGQKDNVCGSISERVAAVRKDAKQGLACDAGFCN